MMSLHKLLVIASAIQCYVHKILKTIRGAENPTGPKLPDLTLCIVEILSLSPLAKKPLESILGPVVQSIVSLTSSLRGQLVKRFTTLLPNTIIFLSKKREKFLHCNCFSHFFQKKILAYLRF